MCRYIYTLCIHTHTLLCLGFRFTFSTKRTAKKLHKEGVFEVQIIVYIAMYFYKHGGKFTL